MLCQIILTPWESKRLIAKAVVQLPEVQHALKNGIVCVTRGTTTSYIVEEISGTLKKEQYCIGCIEPDRLCLVPAEYRLPEIAFVKGELKEIPSADIIKEMEADDVFIKGANAVDPYFEAAILLGSASGGTIGAAIGAVYAKGINFVIRLNLGRQQPTLLDDEDRRVKLHVTRGKHVSYRGLRYKGKVQVNVVGMWRRGLKEPLWVITNLDPEEGLSFLNPILNCFVMFSTIIVSIIASPQIWFLVL